MKKSSISAAIAAAALLAAANISNAADEATITGKVVFKGTAPTEKQIDMGADAACKAMHSEAVTTRHYIVGADGALANVFVYVKEGLEGKPFEPPKTPVVLDQKGCVYNPYVFGIQVDQPLEIVNDDDTLHNVHATPKVNEEFNKGQPVKGMKFTHKFTKPEVPVRFKCDVHPWMFAYIGVVANPFFDTTKDAGTFTLKGLPPGEYTIAAWHPKGGEQTQKVKVGAGESKTADFTYEAK